MNQKHGLHDQGKTFSLFDLTENALVICPLTSPWSQTADRRNAYLSVRGPGWDAGSPMAVLEELSKWPPLGHQPHHPRDGSENRSRMG